MATRILAKAVTFRDDGVCALLSFADDPKTPVHYLILQMTNQPDQQDKALGLDGVHIELGPFRVDGYGLVQDILELDADILVRLTTDAALRAGVDQDIEIQLESDMLDRASVSDAVCRFKERL